jgi:CRISPR-associated protein (TIGR03984 family)
MTREILPLGWEINPVDADIPATEVLYDWLLHYMTDGDILLAHAVDGVIWGKVVDGQLSISHDVDSKISPELRVETLQQLRVFNAERELYLWQDRGGWQACYANEFPDENVHAVLKEHHILWGTKGILQKHGFTLLEDGSQGLRHIIPIDASGVNENQDEKKKKRQQVRAALNIHHYLKTNDETGVASIVYSRLAGIHVVKYAQTHDGTIKAVNYGEE